MSIERLAGPNKFVGKKVDLHGIVGPPIDTSEFNIFNMNSADNPNFFVLVKGDAKDLEQNQHLRAVSCKNPLLVKIRSVAGERTP
jgi:hypothetical protein